MPNKVSVNNTKAQILKAYEELLKEVEAKKADNPKVLHKEQEEKKKVASATAKTEEGIVKNIAELKLKIGDSLDAIAKNLLSEKEQLREIQEAIAIEKKNLEDLYGISANADTLAALLLAQEEKKKSFEEEMKNRKSEFDEKMAREKAAFGEEMKNQRAAWLQEKKETAQKQKEEKEEQLKKRAREEEEYKYNLAQTRKKEQDAYDLKKELQERELEEKRAAFEKEISEREKAVTEAENELNTLREQVTQFPKELEKAVKSTEVRITKELQGQYKFEKELLAKETEGKLNLLKQTIQTLEAKIIEQDNLIKQLSQKADVSEKTVKDIALKALDTASKIPASVTKEPKQSE